MDVDDETAHTNAWITNDSHRLKLCERNGKKTDNKYKENDYDNVIIMAAAIAAAAEAARAATAMVVMAAAAAAVTVAVAATTEFNTSQCLRYILQPLRVNGFLCVLSTHTYKHLLRVCGGWLWLAVCIHVRASVCVYTVSFCVNFYKFRLSCSYKCFIYRRCAFLCMLIRQLFFIWCSSIRSLYMAFCKHHHKDLPTKR